MSSFSYKVQSDAGHLVQIRNRIFVHWRIRGVSFWYTKKVINKGSLIGYRFKEIQQIKYCWENIRSGLSAATSVYFNVIRSGRYRSIFIAQFWFYKWNVIKQLQYFSAFLRRNIKGANDRNKLLNEKVSTKVWRGILSSEVKTAINIS